MFFMILQPVFLDKHWKYRIDELFYMWWFLGVTFGVPPDLHMRWSLRAHTWTPVALCIQGVISGMGMAWWPWSLLRADVLEENLRHLVSTVMACRMGRAVVTTCCIVVNWPERGAETDFYQFNLEWLWAVCGLYKIFAVVISWYGTMFRGSLHFNSGIGRKES